MKTNLWSSAATNGFLLALVTIIFTLLQTAFPMEGMGAMILIWFVKLVATIGALYYFMKSFGESEESYPYGAAFTYGFVVSFCSSIIIAAYSWLHYTVIFPDALEKTLTIMEQALASRANTDQRVIDLVTKNLPVIMSVVPLILYTIYGLIFSAIIASFVKKEEPPFAQEMEA